jgi:thiamine biosynthesis protein ThiS
MMSNLELTVTLNGEPRQLAAPVSLEGLLQQLGLDPRAVVVEHNRRIVRRAQLAETAVSQGDAIEVVHFVGGG